MLQRRKAGYKKDALGELIWAYYQKKPSYEIIEHKDGQIGISAGAPLYFSEFKEWPAHLRKSMRFAHGAVLDIGCGAGRACLYLQQKKQEVMGIDASPLAVAVSRKRGVERVKQLRLEEVDKLPHGSFDSVLMFGNGFGLFGSALKARHCLKKLAKITRNGAILLAESCNPYWRKRARNSNTKKFDTLGRRQIIRVRFKDYASDWFDWLSVSKQEMSAIAKAAGWKLKNVIEAPGSPYYVGVLQKI